MATVVPKVDRGIEMQDTRICAEPLAELPPQPSRRSYGAGDSIDGKYELEALLGRGGMGEVWTARNETLGVRRAVKLIRADAGSAENTDRLLHEARAAARLADPSIVRVFDFGKTATGDPYIVMELLEGEDLLCVINRRERLSPTKAVRVLLPLIRALGAAHAHGIVHRDLKPENIFLAKLQDGRVQPKLLDFGIAKLKNARALRLTTAGAVVGSPLYMAPEQARGEDVDERADIWAICVVLYEAMTGAPPFAGEDRAAVARAVMDVEPKSLSDHGVGDATLWPILARGLKKRRDERYQSMQELGRALAGWLLEAGIIDDITGASLEASWFRSSRHSLFASSLPPDRALGGARRAGLSALAIGREAARSSLEQVRRALRRAHAELQRLEPRRQAALGALLVIVLVAGALLPLAWLDSAEREAEPEAPAVAAPAPSARSAPSAPALSAEPQPVSTAADPSAGGGAKANVEESPTPPVTEEAADTRAAPRHSTRPPVRRTPRPARAPRERAKEDRRSKLIDPYQ